MALFGKIKNSDRMPIPPIGISVVYWGSTDPIDTDWLLEEGRLLLRADYAGLFALVGTTHGSTTGLNFRLPDSRGRVIVGADDMGTAQGAAGRIPNSPRTLGATGGEERHTMTTAELVAHIHNITVNSAGTHSHGGATTVASIAHAHQSQDGRPFLTDHAGIGGGVYDLVGGPDIGNPGGGFTATADLVHAHGINADGAHVHTASASSTGSSTPFNVMQPYIVANRIILVK